MTTTDRRGPATTAERTSHPLYSALVGLAALGVLLQGLWAGLIVQEGKDYNDGWVKVHALGAETTIALSAVATIVAFAAMRARRMDLVIGSAAFTALLIGESYIGGIIGAHSSLTAVHFPIAMGLMGLAVWLPLRARHRD